MFWIPMAVGAALGAAKNIEARNQASAERKRQAAMTRFSPWTGMQGSTVKDPSAIGDISGGAMAGAAFGQGLDKFNAEMAANPKPTEFASSFSAPNSNMGASLGSPDAGDANFASKFSLTDAKPPMGSAGGLGQAGMGASMVAPGGNSMAGGSPWGGMQQMDPNDPFGIYKKQFPQAS